MSADGERLRQIDADVYRQRCVTARTAHGREAVRTDADHGIVARPRDRSIVPARRHPRSGRAAAGRRRRLLTIGSPATLPLVARRARRTRPSADDGGEYRRHDADRGSAADRRQRSDSQASGAQSERLVTRAPPPRRRSHRNAPDARRRRHHHGEGLDVPRLCVRNRSTDAPLRVAGAVGIADALQTYDRLTAASATSAMSIELVAARTGIWLCVEASVRRGVVFRWHARHISKPRTSSNRRAIVRKAPPEIVKRGRTPCNS